MPRNINLSLEYIAGFFDGEGSVTVNSRTRGKHGPVYNVVICLSNTDLELLKAIIEFIGVGSLHVSPGVNHPVGNIHISNRKAYLFAKLLAPYCITKRNQLELAIDFYDELNNSLKGWGRSVHYLEKRRHYEERAESYKAQLKSIRHIYGDQQNANG